MAETITLRCKSCGNTVERKKHCAYTGIEHGRGWVYICDCRGEMEVVDIVSNSPYLCDILVDIPTEDMIPWRIFRVTNKEAEAQEDADDEKKLRVYNEDTDCEPMWGTSIIEQMQEANKALDERFFDTLAAAGKRLDMEEVPTKGRTLKMWTFSDDSEIS